ncbi:MAG: pyridoxamine 5'-phosphate oxidase family protein [Pseudomonadota bacterium]
MNKLSKPMQQLIRNYNAGAVATVNDDGSPAVSPKATFVIVNDQCIAYGNIRSPGTHANLASRPAVEITFIDVLQRLAVRVKGQAEIAAKDSETGQKLMPFFEESWAAYLDVMEDFVCIHIERAELITSPGYDVGLSRDEMVAANFDKISQLA